MGKPLSPQELRTGLVALNVIILLTALAAIGFDLYVTALVSTLDFGWWIQNIVFGTSVSGVLMGIFALCGSSMALSANSRNRPTEWRSACWLNGTAFVWCLIHFGLWVTCLVFGILDIGMYTIGAAMLILLVGFSIGGFFRAKELTLGYRFFGSADCLGLLERPTLPRHLR